MDEVTCGPHYNRVVQLLSRITLVALLGATVLTAPGARTWVFLGSDHRLHYRTDERGDRIMDFSHAGYS